MVSIAIEASIEVAEVAAEAIAETVAETVAETAAESAAEGAAEAAAETAAESAAETAAETAAEEAAETTAEEAAETAAEEAAETAAEEAATSSSMLGKVVKVGALLIVGLGVGSIIDLIKAHTGAGKKKCSLDADDQHKLDLVQDALGTISGIVSKWNGTLKRLPKDTDFGTSTVKVDGKTHQVSVSAVFWGMLNDAKKAFSGAETISSQCAESCAWKANMQAFTLGVVNAVTGLLAVCNLGQQSPGMQKYNVPASGDKAAIQGVLDKDFPTWKEYIKRKAERSLNKMKIQQAAQKASQAILPVVQQPITQGIQTQLKQGLQQKIVANAKAAGKSAAKQIFDDRRKNIILTSLIPFYGWVKGPMMISDASRDAKAAAKTAAQTSVQEAFNSTQTKDQMDQITKAVTEDVFAAHKAQIDQLVKQAVNEVLKN